MLIYKIIGILGLLIITVGVIIKNKKISDILFIIGGICLTLYSIYLGDAIFIILQLVFILAAIYSLFKTQSKNKKLQSK
jgi:lipid-A-disaccharide synthase-like uncharacterized protein